MYQGSPIGLEQVIEDTYREVDQRFDYHDFADLSRSNLCSALTDTFFRRIGGVGVRRELLMCNKSAAYWHFLIVHSLSEPSETDVVTDLSPWQFSSDVPENTGYFHGPRLELIRRLQEADTRWQRIETVRSTSVVSPHTLAIAPLDPLVAEDVLRYKHRHKLH
jgi:hypothetical protein